MDNDTIRAYLNMTEAGDKGAFESLMTGISQRILNIAFRLTRDKMTAEDVLNTVLMRIWERAGKIARLANPSGYISTMAYNAALDVLRKRRELPLAEEVLPASGSEETHSEVALAMLTLPEFERDVVLLKVHAGLSFREIAIMLKSTKKRVYLAYGRAAEKLRKQLS